MNETIEFRISEEKAARHLPDDLGAPLRSGSSVRKVVLDPSDPWFAEIGRIDRSLRKKGRALFTAWIPHRRYAPGELRRSGLVRLWITAVFEPAGEECGTRYDESTACPSCGSGATQTTPLFLDGRRIPRGADLAETVAGEVIASSRLRGCWQRTRCRGARFTPVRLANKGGEASSDWYQLHLTSKPVELDARTRVGQDPFHVGADACSRHDLVALNLISEASLVANTYAGTDVVRTRQFFGARRGLLRPQPLLLVSPRVWSAMERDKLKGFKAEAAHLV
jgi:hypothetical protein